MTCYTWEEEEEFLTWQQNHHKLESRLRGIRHPFHTRLCWWELSAVKVCQKSIYQNRWLDILDLPLAAIRTTVLLNRKCSWKAFAYQQDITDVFDVQSFERNRGVEWDKLGDILLSDLLARFSCIHIYTSPALSRVSNTSERQQPLQETDLWPFSHGRLYVLPFAHLQKGFEDSQSLCRKAWTWYMVAGYITRLDEPGVALRFVDFLLGK